MAKPRRSTKPTKQRPSVYQLKVTLDEIEPPIWRRILVEGDTTFAKLHVIIQEAMGWQNYHLHMFEFGDRRIGIPDEEYPEPVDDERSLRIGKVLPPVGATTFHYEYDFGDSWGHQILVEEVAPPDPRYAYPLCIAGARACPPEDCGGTGGYMDLLAALRDGNHEGHDQLVTWVGGVFDPEGFDVNRTNRAIRDALAPRR
jgi:hypothetical protein